MFPRCFIVQFVNGLRINFNCRGGIAPFMWPCHILHSTICNYKGLQRILLPLTIVFSCQRLLHLFGYSHSRHI
ncbi:hypothetical protein SUGI_0388410 [Cryptomeria japonica]|nr:hypothetical protein SUGI_0388410 [Cryptomeria japonica]